MALTSQLIAQYRSLLVGLLPPGRLWQPRLQPNFNTLLESCAKELARADDRVRDMLIEIDPRFANELLDSWGELVALPDECTPEDQDAIDFRKQIVQKLTNIGGLSKTFYEFVGLQFGFTITVTNWINFVAGRGRAGDPLTNYFYRHFVAGSPAGMQLVEVGWRFYFNVEMPATASEHFVAGSFAGDPLRVFSNELIQCTIRKLKPAYAGVTFSFKE